jgi:hypothetical protein
MTQLLALHLFAVWLGRARGTLSSDACVVDGRLEALVQLMPEALVEGLVSQSDAVGQIAAKYVHAT